MFAGGRKSPAEYWIWVEMRQRCENRKCWAYKWYGARGIKVCSQWGKYQNFIEDMGTRTSAKHQLDRIDNERGYSPDNCRWSTSKENCNNRSNAIRLDGVPIQDIADKLGISYSTIYSRYQRGWDIVQIGERIKKGKRITNRFITANGVTKTLSEWAVCTKLSVQTISDRLNRGLPSAEAVNARRTRPKGENNKQAKLTSEQVKYIRRSKKSGRSLSRELQVSDGLIYAIRAGRIWKHV